MVNIFSDTIYVIFTKKVRFCLYWIKKRILLFSNVTKLQNKTLLSLCWIGMKGGGGAQYNQKVKIDQINVLNEKIKTSFIWPKSKMLNYCIYNIINPPKYELKITTNKNINSQQSKQRREGSFLVLNDLIKNIAGYAWHCNLELFKATFWLTSGRHLEHTFMNKDKRFQSKGHDDSTYKYHPCT